MREDKYAAIANYLGEKFPNGKIVITKDSAFDHEHLTQTFEIYLEQNIHLLRVRRSFIDDYDSPVITERFERMRLSELLIKKSNDAILVSKEGIEILTH